MMQTNSLILSPLGQKFEDCFASLNMLEISKQIIDVGQLSFCNISSRTVLGKYWNLSRDTNNRASGKCFSVNSRKTHPNKVCRLYYEYIFEEIWKKSEKLIEFFLSLQRNNNTVFGWKEMEGKEGETLEGWGSLVWITKWEGRNLEGRDLEGLGGSFLLRYQSFQNYHLISLPFLFPSFPSPSFPFLPFLNKHCRCSNECSSLELLCFVSYFS